MSPTRHITTLLVALLLLGVSSQTASGETTASDTTTPDEVVTSDTTTLRPVWSSFMLNAGSSHIADTYLSPVKYSGWSAGFQYSRIQAMAFAPSQWVMQLNIGVNVASALNPGGNSKMWSADLDASWAMMRRWQLPSGFSAGAGPAAFIDLGCLYLARNGNNPASAKASVDLGASAYCAWNTRLLSIPVILRYEAALPAIGAFFAPDYGELYYEIYLGNHSGLAHCGWWGNHFRYDHRITADIRFGATALRVGYAGEIISTGINHTTHRQLTHTAIIGISGEWLSINPRRQTSATTRIISATY